MINFDDFVACIRFVQFVVAAAIQEISRTIFLIRILKVNQRCLTISFKKQEDVSCMLWYHIVAAI